MMNTTHRINCRSSVQLNNEPARPVCGKGFMRTNCKWGLFTATHLTMAQSIKMALLILVFDGLQPMSNM